MAAEACPSAVLTAFTEQPAEISLDAKAWRRSWNRIADSPARLRV